MKKMDTLVYSLAKLIAAVPLASLAKSKVRVCHTPASVTVASVSTETVGSVRFSALRRTGIPASGDQTRTFIVVAPGSKGKASAKPITSPTVVPAHNSAVPVFTDCITMLPALVGSITVSEAFPPKSAMP